MVTTGINTDQQIDALHIKYGTQAYFETRLKSMMTSCFVYGGIEKDSYNFNTYIEPFNKQLSDEVFDAVYTEQKLFLEKCTVNNNVYQDCEGVIYNSINYQEA